MLHRQWSGCRAHLICSMERLSYHYDLQSNTMLNLNNITLYKQGSAVIAISAETGTDVQCQLHLGRAMPWEGCTMA